MKRHVVGKNDPHIVTFTYVFDEKVVSKTGGKKVAITAANGNIPLSMEKNTPLNSHGYNGQRSHTVAIKYA